MSPLPSPPQTGLLFFGGAQWNWITTALQSLYLLDSAQVNILSTFATKLEVIMASLDDLKAAADTMAANEQALATEVGAVHTAVTNLIAEVEDLKSHAGLSADDQAKLDAAVTEVQSASADLAVQTQSLTADDASATAETAPPTP